MNTSCKTEKNEISTLEFSALFNERSPEIFRREVQNVQVLQRERCGVHLDRRITKSLDSLLDGRVICRDTYRRTSCEDQDKNARYSPEIQPNHSNKRKARRKKNHVEALVAREEQYSKFEDDKNKGHSQPSPSGTQGKNSSLWQKCQKRLMMMYSSRIHHTNKEQRYRPDWPWTRLDRGTRRIGVLDGSDGLERERTKARVVWKRMGEEESKKAENGK